MSPKDAEGITNNVNPDQSDIGLHCLLKPMQVKTIDHFICN